MKKISIIGLSLFSFTYCFPFQVFSNSNPSTDSLIATLPTLQNEAQIDQLLIIADQLESSDSSIQFLQTAIEKAEKIAYREGIAKGNFKLGSMLKQKIDARF